MNKYTEIYGVDISKDVFDVMDSEGAYMQYPNGSKGFGRLSKKLPKGSLVVMEATGYCHYRLAQYLYEHGHCVSVVNPLSVKRFIQMKLSKVKTDKSDARASPELSRRDSGEENQGNLTFIRLLMFVTYTFRKDRYGLIDRIG